MRSNMKGQDFLKFTQKKKKKKILKHKWPKTI